MAESAQWQFLPEWGDRPWWIVLPLDGTTVRRGYGPFNATEAKWAGEVHGVSFAAVTDAAAGVPALPDEQTFVGVKGGV